MQRPGLRAAPRLRAVSASSRAARRRPGAETRRAARGHQDGWSQRGGGHAQGPIVVLACAVRPPRPTEA
eukprot:6744872-Pyramimonas_sp.AAC.1